MGGSKLDWRGIVMVLVYLFFPISASYGQRITGQSAADAFSRGDFSVAYEQYSTLIGSFPRDPAYLYGAGVSLIRLSLKPEEATGLLFRALAASSSVRSAPADTRFYLARALHLSGRFEEAAGEYEKYALAAGRREARDRGIAELIEQCSNQSGQLANTIPKTESTVLQAIDLGHKPDTAFEAVSSLIPPVIRATPPDTLPKQIDILLSDALRLRADADAGKSGSSDSLLLIAGVPVLQDRRVLPDQVKQAADTAIRVPVSHVQTPADTLQISRQIPAAGDTPISETIKSAKPLLQSSGSAPVTSLFALKDQPHYTRTNQVTVSAAFPPGLLYTVQLAVFRNPVEPSHFKRLYPVFGVKIPGRELTTYYAGLFRTMSEASKSLQSIRNEGFRDAFITILMDGKAVSAERGTILEKEWGTKALPAWAGVVPDDAATTATTTTTVSAPTTIAADTIPPTLLFRIEVMRTNKADNKQLIEEISRVAGDRGFEIMNPANGIYVYIVGKFLTFETASAYADLLRRNGYKEAKVAAYAGSREIPVETALKLFERKN
jgi:hypothetical protein